MLLLTACFLLFISSPTTLQSISYIKYMCMGYVEKGRKDVNMMLMGKYTTMNEHFYEFHFYFYFILCTEKWKLKIIKRAEFNYSIFCFRILMWNCCKEDKRWDFRVISIIFWVNLVQIKYFWELFKQKLLNLKE